MAGIAIGAVGAQLDRATLRHPLVAAIVPPPFRSFALAPLADQAMDAGDVTTAQARARALIIKHPVPAESLSKLGIVALQAGDRAQAVSALALSAQRGWRDAVAQRVTASSAIDVGEWGVAADRVAALWQTRKVLDTDGDLTREVMANSAARRAFLERIAGFPLVVDDFLAWSGSNLPPEHITQGVKTLRGAGVQVNCGAMQEQTARLVGEGRVPQAAALWYAACTDGHVYSARDFSFATSDGQPSGPFDWSYPGVAGVERTFAERRPRGFTLSYENANPVRKPIASIVARLAPGTHQVGLLPASDVRDIYATITCLEEGTRGGRTVQLMLSDGPAPFTIPAQSCAAQRIVLLAAQGSGALNGLAID
jgi:hypothetical protein